MSTAETNTSNIEARDIAAGRVALATHARSFRLAARFLSAREHDQAAVIYAFCRFVDDAVDEAASLAQAKDNLAAITKDLEREEPQNNTIAAFKRVATEAAIPPHAARDLIDGMASDLGNVSVQTLDELIVYCYRAAGTVGLMMCPVLGVDLTTQGWRHAIDLGIAMQLTNIARDVAEDADRDRIYLPAEWLDPGVTLAPNAPECRRWLQALPDETMKEVVRRLLELAERYYLSGSIGLGYIPARPRFAITVAARIYRRIGIRLLEAHDADPRHGRTVVPAVAKLLQIVVAAGVWFATLFRRPKPHDADLHHPLRRMSVGQQT